MEEDKTHLKNYEDNTHIEEYVCDIIYAAVDDDYKVNAKRKC